MGSVGISVITPAKRFLTERNLQPLQLVRGRLRKRKIKHAKPVAAAVAA